MIHEYDFLLKRLIKLKDLKFAKKSHMVGMEHDSCSLSYPLKNQKKSELNFSRDDFIEKNKIKEN